MSWLKIDDQFPENDSVADLTDRAFRLHVIALCYCARNLTDGVLDKRAVRVAGAVLTAARANRWVKELEDAGLWIPRGDGAYEVKNYLEYNPTAEEAKEDRAKARQRMRELRKRRRENEKPPGDDERSGEQQDERSEERSGADGSGTPSRPVEIENPRAVDLHESNGPDFEIPVIKLRSI